MGEITIPVAKPLLGQEEIDQVLAVLRSGMLVEGKKVEELQQLFAKFLRVKHALAVTNGTMAIYAALATAGVGYGDEVLVPDFTFAATAGAAVWLGARPVLVDIDPETFTMRADLVETALRKDRRNPKVIMPVHLYGYPAAVRELKALADEFGAVLVEDAAQAHGAAIGETKVGTFGIGCFSLYATKNVFTGEGGMVTTNDDMVAEKIYLLAHHGTPHGARYVHASPGLNLRMPDLLAAIGVSLMGKIDEWTRMRQFNAWYLTQGLAGIEGIVTPKVEAGMTHVYHQYTIRVTEKFPLTRDDLKTFLGGKGIGTGVHYPSALHEQDAFKAFQRYGGEEAERAGREILCLPVGPWLTEEDLEKITKAVQEAASFIRV